MSKNGPAKITVSSKYEPSQDPTPASKSGGVEFIPPSNGCTICSDKDLGGTKRNHIKKDTVYSLQQFTVGEKIIYDLYAYGTECPKERHKESVGNSIIVGS